MFLTIDDPLSVKLVHCTLMSSSCHKVSKILTSKRVH